VAAGPSLTEVSGAAPLLEVWNKADRLDQCERTEAQRALYGEQA
jgi:hypothetical protein